MNLTWKLLRTVESSTDGPAAELRHYAHVKIRQDCQIQVAASSPDAYRLCIQRGDQLADVQWSYEDGQYTAGPVYFSVAKSDRKLTIWSSKPLGDNPSRLVAAYSPVSSSPLEVQLEMMQRRVRSVESSENVRETNWRQHLKSIANDLCQLLDQCPNEGLVQLSGRLRKALMHTADYAAAAEISSRIVEYSKIMYGEASRRFVAASGDYAVDLKETGRLEDALAIEVQVLRALRQSDSPSPRLLCTVHVELGLTLDSLGRTLEARVYLERAASIEKRLGAQESHTSEIARMHYADLLHRLGDWSRSIPLLESVRDDRYTRLGRQDQLSQRVELELIECQVEAGLGSEIVDRAEECFGYFTKAVGLPSQYRFRSLFALAHCLESAERLDDAQRLLLSHRHPSAGARLSAQVDQILIEICLAQGRLQEAYEMYLEFERRLAENGEPQHQLMSRRLAVMLMHFGRMQEAAAVLQRKLAADAKWVHEALPWMTSRDAELAYRRVKPSIDLFFDLAGDGELPGSLSIIENDVLRLLLLAKGLPDAAAEVVRVRARSGFVSRLLGEAPGATDLDADSRDLTGTLAVQELEHGDPGVARWHALAAQIDDSARPTALSLEACLLVLHCADLKARGESMEVVFAWVVHGDGRKALFRIGELAEIEECATEFLQCIEDGYPDAVHSVGECTGYTVLMEAGGRLVDMLRPVLIEILGSCKSLIVMPTEILAMVPWDSLPFGDGLLGGQFAGIRHVTSPFSFEVSTPDHGRGTAVVAGGLDYDATSCDHEAADVLVDGLRPFLPLSHSGVEALGVAEILSERYDVSLYEGDRCCRHRLFESLANASLAHLATHGHFSRPPALHSGVDSQSVMAHWRVQEPLDYVMLALSGANLARAPGVFGQGILTGAYIADAADLSKMRLCVLSACALSVGMRGPLGTVSSVQQAFLLAGCEAVLAPVVSVPDEALGRCMEGFYWDFVTGASMHEALWNLKSKKWGADTPLAAWAGWIIMERGLEIRRHHS